MNQGKVNIGGDCRPGSRAEVVPIYQRHPQCQHVCHLPAHPEKTGRDRRRVRHREPATPISTSLLKDPDVDAVHINSPIPDHGWQSIAALKAGKHVACTVPMATSIEDCKKIVRSRQKKTGLKYMMMETVVYAREFLYMKELLRQRRARQTAVPPGEPSAGHGRLAELLARPAADVVCDPLRRRRFAAMANLTAEYVCCFGSGTISQGTRSAVRLAVRRGDRAHQIQGHLTSPRASFRSLVRHAPANIARASMFMARKASRGMAAGRARAARVMHTAKRPEAEDSEAGQSARLTRSACRRKSGPFTTKGVYDLGQEDASELSRKAQAMAVRIRTGPTNS